MKRLVMGGCGLLLSLLLLAGCGGGGGGGSTSSPATKIVASASFDDNSLQGWSADGLWHVSDTQASNGGYSAWYADPTRSTFETFDSADPTTATANAGSLVSPLLTLGNNPTLDFDYQLNNECTATAENFICDYDALTVEVSTDDGVLFTPLAVLPETVAGFKSHKVDLYGYAGQTVRIRFHFDTYDEVGNNYSGAYVDNIVVTDHADLVTDAFPLTLSDNMSGSMEMPAVEVSLPFAFPFQGTNYTSTSLNINGYLDFGGSVSENAPTATAFMAGLPRIAMLWNHLAPQGGGSISYRRTATSIVFTLAGVNGSNGQPNDLSATLNADGSIELAYGTLNATAALVGITPGGGATDPGETDLTVTPNQPSSGVVYEQFTGGGTDDIDLSDTTLIFAY